MAKPDNIDQIQRNIAAARNEVSYTIQGLVFKLHPTTIKGNVEDMAKACATEKANQAKAAFVDESGPRWDRIGTVALASSGVVVLAVATRGIGRLLFRH